MSGPTLSYTLGCSVTLRIQNAWAPALSTPSLGLPAFWVNQAGYAANIAAGETSLVRLLVWRSLPPSFTFAIVSPPQELVSTLCNRRYTEKSIAYTESHDQGLVGDQTIGALPWFTEHNALGVASCLAFTPHLRDISQYKL